jgi:hypothetical protein
MIEYDVTARRWAHGWELHITRDGEEVGVTQSLDLDAAEETVRDYLALDTGADPASFDVIIRPVDRAGM